MMQYVAKLNTLQRLCMHDDYMHTVTVYSKP